jgi:hypothetical protein
MAFRLHPVGTHGPKALHVKGHFVKQILSMVSSRSLGWRWLGLGRGRARNSYVIPIVDSKFSLLLPLESHSRLQILTPSASSHYSLNYSFQLSELPWIEMGQLGGQCCPDLVNPSPLPSQGLPDPVHQAHSDTTPTPGILNLCGRIWAGVCWSLFQGILMWARSKRDRFQLNMKSLLIVKNVLQYGSFLYRNHLRPSK